MSALGTPRLAKAASITTSSSYPLSTTNYHGVLSLSRFDPSLGTLTGVRFRLQGNVVGDVRFESMDSKPVSVHTFLQATVSLSRPDFTPLVITLPVANFTDDVSAYDGVIDFGGTSGRSYLGLSAADADSADSPPPPGDIALFTGTTPVSLPIAAVGASYASGSGNLITSFRTMVATKAIVTYFYEPWPPGACCGPDGACTYVPQSECATGDWRVGVLCEPNPCPPTGSCCYPDGSCAATLEAGCTGIWTMSGVCVPDPCEQPPVGGCCDFATGACTVTTQAACALTWLGPGAVCDVQTCPPPAFEGACCAPNGDCRISTQAQCPGTWILHGVCSPNPCPQPPIGVCCDAMGICTMTTQSACQGQWSVGGTCTPNPCPPIPVEETSWGQLKNLFR